MLRTFMQVKPFSGLLRNLHKLPALPFPIEKGVGKLCTPTQLDFHYNKHHNTYVVKANGMIKGTPFEDMSLEDTIMKTAGVASQVGLFNNVAQIWNHTFYWKSMTPTGSKVPALVEQKLTKEFGGVMPFLDKFVASATGLFGSGWAWLVQRKDGSLAIRNTQNAENPMTMSEKPLLTCDVWEHAYYLDHQNRRPDYLQEFVKVINWEFVQDQLSG